MRCLVLVLAIAACAARPNAPVAPRNFAADYVAAIDPEARVLPWGSDAVLARHDLQLFVCLADEQHRTRCHPLADLTPKPPIPPAPPTPSPPAAAHDGSGPEKAADKPPEKPRPPAKK